MKIHAGPRAPGRRCPRNFRGGHYHRAHSRPRKDSERSVQYSYNFGARLTSSAPLAGARAREEPPYLSLNGHIAVVRLRGNFERRSNSREAKTNTRKTNRKKSLENSALCGWNIDRLSTVIRRRAALLAGNDRLANKLRSFNVAIDWRTWNCVTCGVWLKQRLIHGVCSGISRSSRFTSSRTEYSSVCVWIWQIAGGAWGSIAPRTWGRTRSSDPVRRQCGRGRLRVRPRNRYEPVRGRKGRSRRCCAWRNGGPTASRKGPARRSRGDRRRIIICTRGPWTWRLRHCRARTGESPLLYLIKNVQLSLI